MGMLPSSPGHRPTRAVVDLAAWRHNLQAVKNRIGPDSGQFAIVKADAYGHGMVQLAREAVRWGVQALGVATADEALCLRETAGLETIPILVMGPTYPEDAEALVKAHVAAAIGTLPLLREHLRVGRELGITPSIHLKVDTGMGRYGFKPEALTFLDLFAAMPEALEGLMTHFSVSDERNKESTAYTKWQLERFLAVRDRLVKAGLKPICHAANSGATLYHPDAYLDIVRPGIMTYGANPEPADGIVDDLEPVMTLASEVIVIHEHDKGDDISYGRTFTMPRDGRVGILPLGYGDGWFRLLSNQAEVLVRGRRAPIIGRVCMDQTMIDLTEVPEARPGDEGVLVGRQGDERISLEELAVKAKTIPYEITCHLTPRVPRVHIDSEA